MAETDDVRVCAAGIDDDDAIGQHEAQLADGLDRIHLEPVDIDDQDIGAERAEHRNVDFRDARIGVRKRRVHRPGEQRKVLWGNGGQATGAGHDIFLLLAKNHRPQTYHR